MKKPNWKPLTWVVIISAAVIIVAVCATFTILFTSYELRSFRILGDSMSPTLINGDHLLADMKAYRRFPPQRGDVVVFQDAADSDRRWIKRVIAVGGDVISGTPDTVSVNGQQLQEAYLQPPSSDDDSLPRDPNETFGPLGVPPNHFFLMGDNRRHSLDSRYPEFGRIGIERIRGKVLVVYWSSRSDRIWTRVR